VKCRPNPLLLPEFNRKERSVDFVASNHAGMSEKRGGKNPQGDGKKKKKKNWEELSGGRLLEYKLGPGRGKTRIEFIPATVGTKGKEYFVTVISMLSARVSLG